MLLYALYFFKFQKKLFLYIFIEIKKEVDFLLFVP